MPVGSDDDAGPLRAPAEEIAYFERRLAETTIQAAAAASKCSHVALSGLAGLYVSELSALRGGPDTMITVSPLVEQAGEAGVTAGSVSDARRPTLSLGFQRNGQT